MNDLLPILQTNDPTGGLMSFLPIILIFVIFYFMIIRPQSKERKLQETMRSNLQKGHKVITQGGLIATVSHVKDKEVVLQIDGAKLTVAKDAVLRRLEDSDAAA